ncbi:MAG: indole-3-glycerol phosphate synthase [Ponticaulis sp.]|nr:indole-3-glycerol phosphate synthase [Ponticaulis sp.]|tara:strand:+ start:38574 stop:39371 length:798 start_codon:yes stop_codon:yes gene_type:complete
MATALDRIIDYKKTEIADLKAKRTLSSFSDEIKTAPPTRGFIAALDQKVRDGQNGLICEIKRKSPSAGDILKDANPIDIAREYERAGAACLSVLTDTPSFGGTLDDLRAVRDAVNIPLLRKDFMVDPIQIYEARANGADCILIILSSTDDILAQELKAASDECGLDVLVEVHDQMELDRALAMNAPLIGVNNRNLKEMTTDLGVSETLSARMSAHSMVSESGVKTADDIQRLQKSGYRRFLIGESLMKETDRELFVRDLVNTKID